MTREQLRRGVIGRAFEMLITAAIAVSLTYSATAGLKNHTQNKEYERNYEVLSDLVRKKDYTLASRTLEALAEDGSIRTTDRVMFELEIQKKVSAEKMAEYLFEKDLIGAKLEFEKLKGLEMPDQEIDYFERKHPFLSEKVLFREINSAKDAKMIKLSEDYLKVYPGGENREVVLQGILTYYFSELEKDINEDAEFEDVFYDLGMFNKTMFTYRDAAKKYFSKKQIKDLTKSIEKYIKRMDKLEEGKEVKIVKLRRGNYYRKYFNERNENFPLGSVGEVIDVQRYEIIVEFPDVEETNWEHGWDYGHEVGWQSDAAGYRRSEIELLSKYAIYKSDLEIEFEHTKEILADF